MFRIVYCRLLVYNGSYNTDDWGIHDMNINSSELRKIQKEKKSFKAFNDSPLLSSFIGVVNNIIELGSNMNSIEMSMFSDSINYWMKARRKKKSSKKCDPGTIVEIEYGLPYKTEIPYRHSGLVIKSYDNKILVVPCTSHKDFLDKAYHPIDNPNGDIAYRKVGIEENFDHDCVLVLDDFKVISKNRIISTCGQVNMDTEESVYYEVRNTIFHNVFTNEIKQYEDEILRLNNVIDSYKMTVYNKKGIIDSLYKTIASQNRKIEKLQKNKRKY